MNRTGFLRLLEEDLLCTILSFKISREEEGANQALALKKSYMLTKKSQKADVAVQKGC